MPSPSYVSTLRFRYICLALIVLALFAAAAVLIKLRIPTEISSREVDVVADYNEIVPIAGEEGVPIVQVLARLKASGITGVALQEETLNTLVSQGVINISPHPEVTQAQYPAAWQPDDQVFVIETPGLHRNQQLFSTLQRLYPSINLIDEPPYLIFVRGSRDAVSNLGLGLAQEKVDQIKGAGLHVIPRLHGGNWVNAETLRTSLLAVQAQVALPGKYPYGGTVIFDGMTIPGYRDLIPDLADIFKTQGMTYGSIEFGKQKGDEELGRALDGRLLRVHSISLEDLANMQTPQIVQRFALAVKDRNIRVLYVHIPPLASADALAGAADYVRQISTELRHEGYSVSADKPAHAFKPLKTPKFLLLLLFLGAGAGLLYWVSIVLPQQVTPALLRIGYAILIIGVIGALATAGMTRLQGEGRALFGLLAAIAFPLLALTWAYRAVDRTVAERPAKPLLPAIHALLIATLITLGGALLVAAIMADRRYLVKVGEFAGVKFALGGPILLFALLIVSDGVARGGENLHEYWTRCRERLLAFCKQPLHVWSVVLVLVALVAVAIVLARSGNDSGMGVSNFELHMRAMLEQWMYARPRTKEFAFGNPLFIFAMFAAARGYRLLALLLLLGAAVGQTDVLNTYCHAHTPVLLSLVRTFNGLWLGIALAILLLAIFARSLLAGKNAPSS